MTKTELEEREELRETLSGLITLAELGFDTMLSASKLLRPSNCFDHDAFGKVKVSPIDFKLMKGQKCLRLAYKTRARLSKPPAGENQCAMRQALKHVIPWLYDTVEEITESAKPVLEECEAALAAPMRNCDTNDNIETLAKTFKKIWCDQFEQSLDDPRTCCSGQCVECVMKWMLAPVDREEREEAER